MEDQDFESFIESARRDLQVKQDDLKSRFGFGSHARWSLDRATQKLHFYDADDQLVIEADVVEIGSFSSRSTSWKWGWSNEALPVAARERSEPLRELAAITGFDLFETATAFEVADESMTWDLAALAVKHLGALGCYKAPSTGKPLDIFLAVAAVNRVAP